MKAVLVRKENAQIVKQRLFLEGALDKTRKILEKENCLEMPVSDSFHANDLAMITQDKPEFYFPKKTLADFIDMTEKEKRLLPCGWQILGDIIIVSLNPELKNRKAEIGEALLCLYPGCITVLLDCGIYGKMRQPAREIIAGSKTETIHRENGCLFKLDAMQLMYSRGNLFEKKRMSKFGKDETVIDMFAGIGYFSIPMAVHSKPGRIISIEINPL
ncbi:MAG: class I SAM-dependent methyltransferase family protein, partial [Candidatus Methanoperedens sp.]|nr:class I SAM-dependent methyltransferase family protein [Candidatus Methanoperedens sp.]